MSRLRIWTGAARPDRVQTRLRPGAARRRRGAAAWVAAVIVAVGCSGTREQQPLEVETGRRAQTTHDGLVRTRGSELAEIWIKPDASLASYDRLMIGEVRMSYQRPPRSRTTSSVRTSGGDANFPLSPEQTEKLERMLREALEKEIESSESWKLADAPAADVLRIDPFLIDLVVRVPPDQPAGRDRTYTTSTGAVTLVLELRDSMTDDILARVADRSEVRQPGAGSQQLTWSNPVSNASAVRATFRRWARIIVARLDTAARIESEGASAGAAPGGSG